jgi:hypothetical protein
LVGATVNLVAIRLARRGGFRSGNCFAGSTISNPDEKSIFSQTKE